MQEYTQGNLQNNPQGKPHGHLHSNPQDNLQGHHSSNITINEMHFEQSNPSHYKQTHPMRNSIFTNSFHDNSASYQSLYQFIKRQKESFQFTNEYMYLPCSITEIMCIEVTLKNILMYNMIVDLLLSLLHANETNDAEGMFEGETNQREESPWRQARGHHSLREMIHQKKKTILLLDLSYEFQFHEFFRLLEHEATQHLLDLYNSNLNPNQDEISLDDFVQYFQGEIDDILTDLFQCLHLPKIRSQVDLSVLLQQVLYNNTQNSNGEDNRVAWDLILINDLNLLKNLPPVNIGDSPFSHLSPLRQKHNIQESTTNAVDISTNQFIIEQLQEENIDLDKLEDEIQHQTFERLVEYLIQLSIEFHIPIVAFKLQQSQFAKQLKSIKDSLQNNPILVASLNVPFMPPAWINLVDETIYLYSKPDGSHAFLITDSKHVTNLLENPIQTKEHPLLMSKIQVENFALICSSSRLLPRRKVGG